MLLGLSLIHIFQIGYLPQEPQLNPEHTVRQAVEESLGEVFSAQKKLDDVYVAYAEENADFDALAAEQARLEAVIAASGSDAEHQLEIAADALRLPPWDALIKNLSGGEKRRVALCKLLLEKPDMLLLDEPTNHLDAESVEWLEQFLVRFPGTVVAVTHDRYFLDNAAEWILELDRGHGIPWKGNYSSWLEQKEARLETENCLLYTSTVSSCCLMPVGWLRALALRRPQAESGQHSCATFSPGYCWATNGLPAMWCWIAGFSTPIRQPYKPFETMRTIPWLNQ